MDEKILIRPALPPDAQAIAQVHIQSWKETYPGIVPDSAIASLSLEERSGAWQRQLEAGQTDERFNFVAEEGGKVLGFASGGRFRAAWALESGLDPALAAKYDGEFQAIYILASHQKRGIGRALAGAVFGELKRRGFKSMLVRVLKENPARGFYEKMGGVKVGESKVKIGVPLDDLAYGWDKIP